MTERPLEVLAGLGSAHLLSEARRGDRARAQTLCGVVVAFALLLARLGVITAVAAVLGVSIITSIPWCGACGT